MKILLRAALVFALAAVAAADKVVLKNGKVYEGTILEQTDALVKIRTAKAALTFQMDQVASIEKGEWAVGELEKKLAALDPAKPASYLEAARSMAGAGREGFDLPTFQRLCEIASKLDPKQAYEAQTLLAKELKTTGNKKAEAHAWRRALFARPDDPDATRAVEPLNAEFAKQGQFQVKQLVEALDLVLHDVLDEAAPKLEAVDVSLMPEDILRELHVPMARFAADIRSRVRCKTCLGLPKVKCASCAGHPGENTCPDCKGKGRKPESVEKNDANEKFADAVCPTCLGMGTVLCLVCKGTRQVSIEFKVENKKSKLPVTFTTEAGHEAETIWKYVDPKTWRSRDGGALVSAVISAKILTGGESICPVCHGAPYSPPQNPVDNEAVKATIDAINKYLEGGKTWDPLGFEPAPFDQDIVRDGCFKLQKGKWVK